MKLINNKKWLLPLLCLTAWQAQAMEAMPDEELADVSGQALMNITKQNGVQPDGSTLSFLRLGINADMYLNTNIAKLRLGDASNPDIDIDNMSISGNCSSNRPSCDAKLTNPFFEIAVKDDGNRTSREVVGFRGSAEAMNALLTFGANNGTANGLNTFSGYMKTTPINGYANTAGTWFTNKVTGRVTVEGAIDYNPHYMETGTEGIWIPAQNNVPFNGPAVTINGSRLTSTTVNATATLPDIAFSGTRKSTVYDLWFWAILFPIYFPSMTINNTNLSGTMHGLQANISLNEKLGFLHKLNVDSPFYLSSQSRDVKWPGAPAGDVARPGWWMSFANPIDLGVLRPAQNIDISPTFGQVATLMSNYLWNNPPTIRYWDAVGSVFTGAVNVNVGSMNLSSSSVNLNLANQPLDAAQNVPVNCWGGRSFC